MTTNEDEHKNWQIITADLFEAENFRGCSLRDFEVNTSVAVEEIKPAKKKE